MYATLLFFSLALALPSKPSTYVTDEAQVIPSQSKSRLETLFSEHEAATGEQIVIAVFKNLGEQDLVDWTNQIFQSWGIGKKGKDNGLILALYWENRKSRIEVGYGLEDRMTDAASSRVLREILAPRLKDRDTGGALEESAFEILQVIGSPLIASGRAQAILEGASRSREQRTRIPIAPLIMALFWVIVVLSRAQFRARMRDVSIMGRNGFRTGGYSSGGGGFFGGGGGFGGGGFSGGGGRSGGGGASGGW